MKFRFPVVIIDEDWRSDSASGLGIRALAKALEDEGMDVVGGFTYFDVTMIANQAARASAFIVSIDDEEITEEGPESQAVRELRKFITETRKRNADIPIFLFGETRTSQHIPNEILKELHGFIHMFEDTPEFVARYILREANNYLSSLPPPPSTRSITKCMRSAKAGRARATRWSSRPSRPTSCWPACRRLRRFSCRSPRRAGSTGIASTKAI